MLSHARLIDDLTVFVSDSGGLCVYKGSWIIMLSLSHHLPWRLLADPFFVVPGVNWSLHLMLGRHTVAFHTGTALPCS